MHTTRRTWGLFVLWTPLGMKVIFVWRDDAFWEMMVEPYLTRFYFNCILPEIVDSRISRSMEIREPIYILEKTTVKEEPTADVQKLEVDQSKRKIDKVKIDEDVFLTEKKEELSMEDEMPPKKKKERKEIILAWDPRNLKPCLTIVKSDTAWLDDEALDAFLQIVREQAALLKNPT